MSSRTVKILGIESSCDETSAAVVENGRKVLSNIVATQINDHKIFGGVVPEIASRKHIESISSVTVKALEAADLSFKDIDAIAVTHAPGLIGSLLVGVNFAKGLSVAMERPLLAVHHLRSHVAANYITHKDLKPPFLCLIVSGGHSHIVNVSDYTRYKIVGRTRDDAAGEVFDKVARSMGLPYPGGVYLDKIANDGDDRAFALPSPKVRDSMYDYSFSGLKTACINIIHNVKQKGGTLNKEDLAASFRKTIVDCLVDKFLTAAKNLNVRCLTIAGGVSANSLLRERLTSESRKLGLNFYMPDISFCGDNAAMVASQGYFEYMDGNFASESLNAMATLSIE